MTTAENEELAFCTECGHQQSAGNTFCIECGAPQAGAPRAASPDSAEASSMSTSRASTRAPKQAAQSTAHVAANQATSSPPEAVPEPAHQQVSQAKPQVASRPRTVSSRRASPGRLAKIGGIVLLVSFALVMLSAAMVPKDEGGQVVFALRAAAGDTTPAAVLLMSQLGALGILLGMVLELVAAVWWVGRQVLARSQG